MHPILPETIAKARAALDAFANGGTIVGALREVGLDPSAFYRVRDSDAAFAAEYKRLRRARADMANDETLAAIAAMGPDADAKITRVRVDTLAAYAARNDPDEYGQRVNHQVDAGPNIAAAIERARLRAPIETKILESTAVEVLTQQNQLLSPMHNIYYEKSAADAPVERGAESEGNPFD